MSSPHYEPGRYLGEIVGQGLTKAGTGTVQIALKIQVLEGTQPKRDLVQQYERTIYLPVTEKTMDYLVPKLQALGYTRDSLRFIDLAVSNCHDMRGTQAEFWCKHESAQDGSGMREKWDVASRQQSKELELKPPDSGQIRQLDMLFGKALKQAAPAAAPKPKAAEPVAAGGITDDDVPF